MFSGGFVSRVHMNSRKCRCEARVVDLSIGLLESVSVTEIKKRRGLSCKEEGGCRSVRALLMVAATERSVARLRCVSRMPGACELCSRCPIPV